MKKNLFLTALVALFAMVTMSFTTKGNEQITSEAAPITISTGANGEIVSISGSAYERPYMISDLSGYTNIRNKPNGKVCMRLKAWTDYKIWTNGRSGGWLKITDIYNITERYHVRLHGSKTGYWIAESILYAV